MSDYDPEAEIEKLGIPVEYLPLHDVLAAWDADRRKVYCAIGLSQTQTRCSLGHELAHIELGHHRCSYGTAPVLSTLSQERAAELWAARKLISVVEVTIAKESGLPTNTIAHALGVTERMYRARLLAEKDDESRWLGNLGADSVTAGRVRST
ncbi:ImmA/IrrE family metallo-endopeptidase [Streptomyces violascens]|uniref:ImmA/IrrE family metallo-endopeptidase n=1 Tax=Streptomyces violascens TaxID=67381 RepID=UPI0036840EC1